MTLKNAKAGLKTLRTGELLILLTVLTSLVLSISGTVAEELQKAGQTDAYNTAMAVSAISLVVTMAITALGNILKVLGVLKASKDGGKFSTALIFAALNVALSIAGTFFFKSGKAADGIRSATGIVNVFTTYFVVAGIQDVADKIGNAELKKKCEKSMFLILRAEVCSVVAQAISMFMKNNPAMNTVAGVIGVVALVISLVSYLIYLGLLKKAVNAL